MHLRSSYGLVLESNKGHSQRFFIDPLSFVPVFFPYFFLQSGIIDHSIFLSIKTKSSFYSFHRVMSVKLNIGFFGATFSFVQENLIDMYTKYS